MTRLLSIVFMFIALPTLAAEPSARQIIESAFQAAGGEAWANAKTLQLVGRGEFFPNGTQDGSYIADDYRMWRAFSGERKVSHGPDGWVRIDSKREGKTIFQVAFDGETTWTQAGPVPAEEAARMWANSFGFGIIREALEDGFRLTRLPDDNVDGHACYMVQITDPKGGSSNFGIGKDDSAIRYVGFITPRGWHERRYGDFFTVPIGPDPAQTEEASEVEDTRPMWKQAGTVRLFYDGVKSNVIYWESANIDAPLAQDLFKYDPEQVASAVPAAD